MKALTGLPTSAYLKVAEEAKIQLADLLQLVQHLEAGASPAFLSRYQPEVSGRLSEAQLRHIESRLREFLDLEDRRITVLTAIRQQNRMTPELQKKIEEITDRYELEDYYLPFKPKRRTPADDATERGLEPLARFLWDQQPDDADIEAVAQTYVKPDSPIACAADALGGARQIIARWLGEDPEIRCALRPILREEAEIVVSAGDQPMREEAAQKKGRSLIGFRSKIGRVPWRQMMAIRRGAREGWLRPNIVLPENRAVEHMLSRLVRNPKTGFCLQLGAAACEAFHQYLVPSFANEASLTLDDRCDTEAAQSFQKNLRKLLMAAPAGPITVIGLETGRRGGWRAAVVGPAGEFLEGAIVHDPDGDRHSEKPSEAAPAEQPVSAAEQAPTESPAPTAAAEEQASAEGVAQAQQTASETAEPAPETVDSPTADAAPADTPPVEVATPTVTAAETPEPVAASGEPAESGPASAQVRASDASAPLTAPPPETAPEPAPEPAPAAAPEAATESEAATATESEAVAAASGEAASATAGAAVPATPVGEASQKAEPAREEKKQPGQPGAQPARRDARIEVPRASLSELITRHKVGAIVIGNGPGIRQVEKFIRSEVRQGGASDVFWVPIHEAGTWIYATSKSARREFPKADPVMRSAISLARRLQDPLAELVKVDPKVLGVGQYHHEVDARKLRNGLRQTMEECVHQTGVDLNTAHLELLALIPGITERVAKRIIDYRREHGKFARREQLRQVSGLNDRIYDQSVGFLRVYGGENPLDATGIRPADYPVAEKILAAAGVSAAEALEKPETLDAVNPEELKTEEHSLESLKSVLREFRPSVRQARGTFTPPAPPVPLRSVEELKAGLKVDGVVTNLAKFGAFVDIGADQDGLVHVSQLSDKFIEEPQAAVKVGDRVSVYILALEKDGKRISLSMKEPRPAAQRPHPGARRLAAASAGQRDRANGGMRRKRKGPERDRAAAQRTFGPDAREKAREQREVDKLSIDQKLALLENKFRTKVE